MGTHSTCISTPAHRLLWGAALVHLALAASLPLAFFEAHYALYGYYLQLSYVDHPPLMGWLQALPQALSDSTIALRIIPICLTLATQYCLIAIARRLFPGRAGLDLALAWLLQLMPISHMVFAAAPDLPLALFSCLALWALLNILAYDRWRDWLALGACLGLAGLSKYSAIALVLSLPLALWVGGRGRRWLLSPKLWAAAALAAALVSPVAIWNAQHDWLSFRFQLGYQAGDQASWSLAALGQALPGQLLFYSPLVLLTLGLLRSHDESLTHGQKLCLIWALPSLLLFAYLAGTGRSSPHWTYAAWLVLTPALALQWLRGWHKPWLRYLSYGWGALVGVLLVFALALPWLSFEDYQHPLRRFVGWQPATQQAQLLRDQWAQEREPGYQTPPSLLVYNWHFAEPIAWYGRPAVVRDARRKVSQFSHWFGHWGPGDRGLLVRPRKTDEPNQVHLNGAECTPVDRYTARLNGHKAQTYHFYRCYWPAQP